MVIKEGMELILKSARFPELEEKAKFAVTTLAFFNDRLLEVNNREHTTCNKR
jgi:hypothetical protein